MNHEEKSKETYSVVKAMEDALAASSNDMGRYFHEEFRWMGNQGCGTKQNLEEFRNNWQLPLRAAFTDRIYKTDKFLADGEWAACFGHIDAIHNWVTVDFPSILAQLGVDVFNGQGWEAYDRGEKKPPKPE